MPDAPGLELLAKELGEAALETVYFRGRATLIVDPRRIRWALGELRAPLRDGGPVRRAHRDAARVAGSL